jgi:hypothetical protein
MIPFPCNGDRSSIREAGSQLSVHPRRSLASSVRCRLGPGAHIAVAITLAAATAFAATAVYAADTIAMFDPGTVQYGYTDGYWTKSHE